MSRKSIIGIDEVGRGPIAGPVSVCAFRMIDLRLKISARKKDMPLRDSKKLTRLQREAWFGQIKVWQEEGKCDFCVTSVSAKEIDRNGISKAIRKALSRSLLEVSRSDFKHKILPDGGLQAPAEFKDQKTIIKGDEKEIVIALASIAAKVTRDAYMRKQAKRFPVYAFDEHVGYGTKKHYKAIKKHGISPIHRRSFLTKMR